MISFQPNTIEETEFRSHQISRRNTRHLHSDLRARESSFTRSCVFQSQYQGSRNMTGTHEEFFSSVHVVATGKGHYSVYQPNAKYAESRPDSVTGQTAQRNLASSGDGESSNPELLRSFKHHISNLSSAKSLSKLPQSDIEDRTRLTVSQTEDSQSNRNGFKNLVNDRGRRVNGRMKNEKKADGSTCSCKSYHIHTFSKPDFCRVSDNYNVEFEVSLSQIRSNLVEANEKHLIICNTFWRPFLAISEFHDGDDVVQFTSLWHEEGNLKELLRDGIQNTVLRTAISDLTLMAVSVGPLQLLKSLIDLSLVRVDSLLEDGAGLLHHACVFRRSDIIQYLVHVGVSPSLKDRQGNTADQCCFSSEIRRSLPTKFHIQTGGGRGVSVKGSGVWGSGGFSRGHILKPSIQDKDVIFSMAAAADSLMELQKRLQMFEFNVNTECNSYGDFIIHVAVKGGLCQLPLMMLLVKVQQADVELCNFKGMTPLMMAAQAGDPILCEVLICVFGARPNKCNVHNGKSPLHYAAQYNHVDTVSCLIRRGADFNREDHNGMRPDDSRTGTYGDDCLNIISTLRAQRCENLSRLTIEGKLRSQELKESDISVVNSDGFTLLMVAALHNRVDSMKVILDFDNSRIKSFIDAQYCQMQGVYDGSLRTGMTALAIAAYHGHTVCVRMLLQRGANPVIGDVEGYLPLHHAVVQNHEEVVDAMLIQDYFPFTYSGLYQACTISKKTSLDRKLRDAWKIRQEKIVMTELMSCAMSGKAEELYRLLEDGDNLNSQTGVGSYPLYLAAENGHLDVVKLLCERGADVKKRHVSSGSTALHIAARMGKLDVVQYLLNFTTTCSNSEHTGDRCSQSRRKLNVNAVNADGKTALQLAAEKGYMQIVKLLLSRGATTALLDGHGVLFSLPEYAYGGVFNEIESHRHKHTNDVMKLIRNKSKKRLQELRKIWKPPFDHNLRDRKSDTPLMVACRVGHTEVANFLLASAVYKQNTTESDTGSDSDADSGVLDAATVTSGTTKLEDSGESFEKHNSAYQRKNSESDSGETQTGQWGQMSGESIRPPSRVESLLSDVEKPKGLSIYHDGFVSHVCAVNFLDGSMPIHRALEGGDNHLILESLLRADVTCINTQNSAGFTPLHLACKLVRKKSLDKLLTTDGIDINLLTLTGQLAEETSSNKSVIKMVQKARKGHPVRQRMPNAAFTVSPSSSVSEAARYHKPPSTTGSTISLEKVHERFEQLKHSHQIRESKDTSKK
ncbi:LOW QUALITY PROTEIN: ankyrin-1-like [Pecten maximus]|uniref:LOW QUALITY PROTEIN: ankyrin-1-like n=1 Tax=Pecten maximus TaxID=6579 RepID=UPI0014584E73|nr:LOW QUALITY PROTEIN: ankyrin-1-like [Pecten maximus]